MAIIWGGWNKYLRVGIDATWTNPKANQGSVTVTWHVYVQCQSPWNFRDNQTIRVGGDGIGARNVNYYNGLNANQQMKIGSWSASYGVSYNNTTSKSFGGTINKAYNGSTASKNRTITIAKRPANTPSAPRNCRVSQITSTTARIDWDAPSDNGGAALGDYNVHCADNAALSPRQWAYTKSGTRNWTVTGLKASTKHWARVRASNSAGQSGYSNVPTFNTQAPPVVGPTTPLNVRTTLVAASSVKVAWDPPANTGGSALSEYGIQISKNINFSPVEMGITGLQDTESEFTGLTKNTQYYVRVQARNGAGWGAWSPTLNVKTPFDISTAPIAFVYTLLPPDVIVFGWGNPVDNGGAPITSYILQVDNYGGDFSNPVQTVNIVPGPSGMPSDMGVNLDVQERWIARICAVTSAGNGTWSRVLDTERAVWVPDPPGPVEIEVLSVTRLSLTLLLTCTNNDVDEDITYDYHFSTSPAFEDEMTRDELWTGEWNAAGNQVRHESFSSGTMYYIRARAMNGGGMGEYGPVMAVETMPPMEFESEKMMRVYLRTGNAWRRTNIHSARRPAAALIPRFIEAITPPDPFERWWDVYEVGWAQANTAVPVVYSFAACESLPLEGDLIWAWITSNDNAVVANSVVDSTGSAWVMAADAAGIAGSQRAGCMAAIAARDYLPTDTLSFGYNLLNNAAKGVAIFGSAGLGLPPLAGRVNGSGSNAVAGNSGAAVLVEAPALISAYCQTGSGGGMITSAAMAGNDLMDTLWRRQVFTNQFQNHFYNWVDDVPDSLQAAFTWATSNGWGAGIAAFPMLPRE